MDFCSVPIIVLCCYIVGEIYKVIFKKNTKTYKLIPILVACVGGVFGIIIFYTAPEILFNVKNLYDALTIGIISGFASTGANQIIKQNIQRKNTEENNEEK